MEKTQKRTKGNGGRKPTQLESLQVHKAFVDMQMYLLRAVYSGTMPRWLKNSVGLSLSNTINFCVECLSVVACSYDTQEKIEHLRLFVRGWNTAFHHIYILGELGGLTKKQRNVILTKRLAVEEQLSAFHRWLEQSKKQSPVAADQNPKTESAL